MFSLKFEAVLLWESRVTFLVVETADTECTMKIPVNPFAASIPPWMRISIVTAFLIIYIGCIMEKFSTNFLVFEKCVKKLCLFFRFKENMEFTYLQNVTK